MVAGICMIIRLLALLVVPVTTASAAASGAAHGDAADAAIFGRSTRAVAAAPAPPEPLRGVPFTGSTGLRLLVANNPPFLLDVDTGRSTPIKGLDVRGHPILSVLAVGKDAVVRLERRVPAGRLPAAEIYVVRHGATSATRLATASEVAPAADGLAVWLKTFADARHCTLREVTLGGGKRRTPRPLPCAARLVDAGAGAVLVQGSSLVDPQTGRTLLRASRVWARTGRFVLTAAGSHASLGLADLVSGERWRLPWPSEIGGADSQGGTDQAAVRADGELLALAFSDPAYEGSGTQVTDIWMLDPGSRRFDHLPDMPAAVSLKFTSMSWTSDGRLVFLGQTARQDIVAVWRPGQDRIAVRPIGLPARNSGSDSFVAWQTAG